MSLQRVYTTSPQSSPTVRCSWYMRHSILQPNCELKNKAVQTNWNYNTTQTPHIIPGSTVLHMVECEQMISVSDRALRSHKKTLVYELPSAPSLSLSPSSSYSHSLTHSHTHTHGWTKPVQRSSTLGSLFDSTAYFNISHHRHLYWWRYHSGEALCETHDWLSSPVPQHTSPQMIITEKNILWANRQAQVPLSSWSVLHFPTWTAYLFQETDKLKSLTQSLRLFPWTHMTHR